jgi:hypothetical protein
MADDKSQAKIGELKDRANKPKSELMKIESELKEISSKEVERISEIISLLERWQNS